MDINDKDNTGNNALFWACGNLNNSENVVKYLIDNGININNKNSYGATALMKACEIGNLKIVKLLVDHGININNKNSYGATALMMACEIGNLKIVKLLVDHGADINVVLNDGSYRTALWLAKVWNKEDVVEFLIKHGAK